MYVITGVDEFGQQFAVVGQTPTQTQLYNTVGEATQACKLYKATYPWCNYYPHCIF